MRKLNFFSTFLLAIFIFSCNPAAKVQTIKSNQPLYYKEPVQILRTLIDLPEGAEKIGIINIGDSGFSVNCGLEKVLDDAKIEARKLGGNILYITRHKTPDFWSTCHRITADVYYFAPIN